MESGVFGVIFISKKGHAGSKCFHRKIKKKNISAKFQVSTTKKSAISCGVGVLFYIVSNSVGLFVVGNLLEQNIVTFSHSATLLYVLHCSLLKLFCLCTLCMQVCLHKFSTIYFQHCHFCKFYSIFFLQAFRIPKYTYVDAESQLEAYCGI